MVDGSHCRDAELVRVLRMRDWGLSPNGMTIATLHPTWAQQPLQKRRAEKQEEKNWRLGKNAGRCCLLDMTCYQAPIFIPTLVISIRPTQDKVRQNSHIDGEADL